MSTWLSVSDCSALNQIQPFMIEMNLKLALYSAKLFVVYKTKLNDVISNPFQSKMYRFPMYNFLSFTLKFESLRFILREQIDIVDLDHNL